MRFWKSGCGIPLLLDGTLGWIAFSTPLHLVWEIAQLPLYTIAWTESVGRIVFAVLHCTAGDAFISGGAYLIAGWVLGAPDWPRTRAAAGSTIALAFGLLTTARSEWVNVYEVESWTYTNDMPLLFGIGVTPVLQWIVVPLLTLMWIRSRSRPITSADDRGASCGDAS